MKNVRLNEDDWPGANGRECNRDTTRLDLHSLSRKIYKIVPNTSRSLKVVEEIMISK